MSDEDLTILDETKPNGDTEEVAVLDEYQRETRKKMKAFLGKEHDLATGAHVIPHGNVAGASLDGGLFYDEYMRELLVSSGGLWRSVAQPTFNFVVNGMFQSMVTSPSRVYPNWNFAGSGAVIANPTQFIYGLNSARIRGGTEYASLSQTISTISNNNSPFSTYLYWRTRVVTLGALVLCPTANCGYLQVYDGVNVYSSAFHPGDNTWRWITLTVPIAATSTVLQVACISAIPGTNTSFAGVTLVEGRSCPHPLPQSFQGKQGVVHVGHPDIQPNTNTPWWYGAQGHGTLPAQVQNALPCDAIVRNFYANATGNIGAGTFTAQIDYSGTLSIILVTLTGAISSGSDLANGFFGAKGGSWSAKVTRNGGATGGFFGSYTWDEVPTMG